METYNNIAQRCQSVNYPAGVSKRSLELASYISHSIVEERRHNRVQYILQYPASLKFGVERDIGNFSKIGVR